MQMIAVVKASDKKISDLLLDDVALLSMFGNADSYSVLFDKNSRSWSPEPNSDYNWLFLRTQQNWCNDMLRSQGYLFLNDVYKILGLPLTAAGQIYGWVYDTGASKAKGFVGLGLEDLEEEQIVDGAIPLNIRVQGPILHAIK